MHNLYLSHVHFLPNVFAYFTYLFLNKNIKNLRLVIKFNKISNDTNKYILINIWHITLV